MLVFILRFETNATSLNCLSICELLTKVLSVVILINNAQTVVEQGKAVVKKE